MSKNATAKTETKTVITKDQNGKVKRTSEVDPKVVNGVIKEPKVQSIIVNVDEGQMSLCVQHYTNRFEDRKADVQELFDFGLLFQSAKKSVNNNNKAFGKWREKNFPSLTNQFVSYVINLVVHKDDVSKWIERTDAEASNREYRNPHSVYTAFNRYKKKLAEEALKELNKDSEFDFNIDDIEDTTGGDTTGGDTTGGDTTGGDTTGGDTTGGDTTGGDTTGGDTTEGGKVISDPTVKSGIRVEGSTSITTEEQVNHYNLIVNQIIILLNSDKLSDEELTAIKKAHGALSNKLNEVA